MINAGRLDLRVNRHTAFVYKIDLVGFNLGEVGATFRAQVRLYPDAPGAPLLAFVPGGAPVEIQNVAGTIENGVPVSTLRMLAQYAGAIATLPPAPETGDDLTLAWDLLIKCSATDDIEQVVLRGDFIVLAGVTQNV